MGTKYRIKEAGGWTYPPTGKYYPEWSVDALADWNKDDIEHCLATGLIERVTTADTRELTQQPDQPAQGTPTHKEK